MEFIKKWLDRKETKKEIKIIEKEIKILDDKKTIKTIKLTNKQYEIKKCEEIYQESQKNIKEVSDDLVKELTTVLQKNRKIANIFLQKYFKKEGMIIRFMISFSKKLYKSDNMASYRAKCFIFILTKLRHQAENQKRQSFLDKEATILREELQQIQEELQIWKNLLDKRQSKLLTK